MNKADTFEVLMLASLRPYKGVSEFITLAKSLPKVNFTLVLSDEKEEVDRFVDGEILPTNIHVFPVQKDVHPFFEKAWLIVNLTHPDECVETFGMTILEGMYYDLPAIVPEIGGGTELVQNDLNGFQINYTKLDKITEIIEKMAAEPDFWERLSKGSAIKKSEFMRKNFEAKVENLLKQ